MGREEIPSPSFKIIKIKSVENNQMCIENQIVDKIKSPEDLSELIVLVLKDKGWEFVQSSGSLNSLIERGMEGSSDFS